MAQSKTHRVRLTEQDVLGAEHQCRNGDRSKLLQMDCHFLLNGLKLIASPSSIHSVTLSLFSHGSATEWKCPRQRGVPSIPAAPGSLQCRRRSDHIEQQAAAVWRAVQGNKRRAFQGEKWVHATARHQGRAGSWSWRDREREKKKEDTLIGDGCFWSWDCVCLCRLACRRDSQSRRTPSWPWRPSYCEQDFVSRVWKTPR